MYDLCCEQTTPGEVVSQKTVLLISVKKTICKAQEVKQINILGKNNFNPQNRNKTHNLTRLALQPNTCGVSLDPNSLYLNTLKGLSFQFPVALNKVKGAEQLPSWTKCQREKWESTDQPPGASGGDRAPRRPPRELSGGIIFIFIVHVIVEGDDGADELAELHKVSCDYVDAALPGSLRSDPLHHAR